jgi:hypothetical protein
VRVFLVGRAMLFVGLTGPRSAFSDEKARAYLDSFVPTP